MEKYYSFAGVDVIVSIPDKWMYDDEKTLKEFKVSQVKNPHYYQFEIVDELSTPIGEKIVEYAGYCVYESGDTQIRYLKSTQCGWEYAHTRMLHKGKNHLIQVKASKYVSRISAKMVLNALNLEYLLAEVNGVILHASYIENNGKALLFTAPSEVGKSTQASLWRDYRSATIVNGDRAVVKVEDGLVYATGIPFSGSSTFCKNKTLPLQAIIYLGQDKNNIIEKIRGLNAFRKVWEGCTINNWNEEDVSRKADLVQQIIEMVPIYYLKCTPDERAIIALEKELQSEQ